MNAYPENGVFLLTDIEGSTRMWEEAPGEMKTALLRHDEILRQCIDEEQGHLLRAMGDAFFASFATVGAAVRTALNAQLRLSQEQWPEAVPIRVRMALYMATGKVQYAEENSLLNRAAALLAAAWGGQILVQGEMQGVIRQTLPAEAFLKEMGMHRLRDLSAPMQVLQMCHPALQANFPPLRSLDSSELPNNLPCQLTSFIGRTGDIEQIRQMLGKTRLLTLTGVGGCGKTRLALQSASAQSGNFPQGIWLVSLAPLSSGDMAVRELANTLQIRETFDCPLLQAVAQYLQGRQVLLILDNCEHIVKECAKIAETLLQRCASLKIMATSREPLNIQGEAVWRVQPLSIPPQEDICSMQSILQHESVMLFTERARHARADVHFSQADMPLLKSICRRLDGLPLALELAAARMRSLTLPELNKRLEDRFRILTGGSRHALQQHQTLRALIDWSYNLLSQQEQELLRALSVFNGSWGVQAAQHICFDGALEEWETEELITSLIDRSLIQQENNRYVLLETIRQYASEKLQPPEATHLQDRHAEYFYEFVMQIAAELKGNGVQQALMRCSQEYDNIRAALKYGISRPELYTATLLMSASLWSYWHMQGRMEEGLEYLKTILKAASAEGEETNASEKLELAQAKAYNSAGILAQICFKYAESVQYQEKSLALCRKHNSAAGIASSLSNLGVVAMYQQDLAHARTLFEEALQLYRSMGLQSGMLSAQINLCLVLRQMGDTEEALRTGEDVLQQLNATEYMAHRNALLNNLGNLTYSMADLVKARAYYTEALEIRRSIGDRWGVASTTSNLALLALFEGSNADAAELAQKALEEMREFGDKRGEGVCLETIGLVFLREGDLAKASELIGSSLQIYLEIDDKSLRIISTEYHAELAMAKNLPVEAAQLLGAAAQMRKDYDMPGDSIEQSERNKLEQLLQQTLPAEQRRSAWQQGAELNSDQLMKLLVQLEKA